ncbi:MAG: hypothetical protein ACREDR_27710 [Blastocatellia bacterium]
MAIPNSAFLAGLQQTFSGQTKRQIIAVLAGLTGTIEKVSAASTKRLSNAFTVIKGDGNSTVDYVDDPAFGTPEVTLSVVVSRADAFVTLARQLAVTHKQNPDSAGPLTIRSYNPDGSIAGSVTLVKAVVQEVRIPDGDTSSHSEAMAEIIVQPRHIL